MACPRCEGQLERYALVDAEAVVCEQCGYIGVPVDHDSEPVEAESWDDAVARVGDVGPAKRTATGEAVPLVEGDGSGSAGALCPDCGQRFESQQGVAVHRGLVHGE